MWRKIPIYRGCHTAARIRRKWSCWSSSNGCRPPQPPENWCANIWNFAGRYHFMGMINSCMFCAFISTDSFLFYSAAFFNGQIEQPVRGLMSFFNQKDIAILVAINERGVFVIDHVNGVRQQASVYPWNRSVTVFFFHSFKYFRHFYWAWNMTNCRGNMPNPVLAMTPTACRAFLFR